MKKFLVILFCYLLCACASKAPLPPQSLEDQETAWQNYLKFSKQAAGSPYRLQMSVRFGQEGDTRRVNAILWGDEEVSRLDVMAGVGVTVAKIQNTPDKFVFYLPRETKAYVQDGANKPLLRIGTPLPFNLAQMANILAGNYTAVFGSRHGKIYTSKGMPVFTLTTKPEGDLELSPTGLPLRWQNGPWKMFLVYEADGTLPSSVRIINANGKMAILRIKERENPAPFTREQLDLELPDGTRIIPFADYKPF